MMLKTGRDNRSQLIAEMISNQLVEHQSQQGKQEMAGTITLVYDHHFPHLQHELTHIQHDFHKCILSTIHVHLDHNNCLEILILRGLARELHTISNKILACNGIKHGKLTMTATGKQW